MSDAIDGYRLRLRALREATTRVQDARDAEALDTVAISAHAALDCVYDLHEAYFAAVPVSRSLADRDAHLASVDGRIVGALGFVRDAKTHDLITAARSAGYGELPYGAGPYGGGWVWREKTTDQPKFATRAAWYADLVQWRLVWEPLQDAYRFFDKHRPA